MKKKFLIFASIILSASVLFSCKKDKETTAQKVQHNWTIVSEIDNFHDASGDNRDTTISVPGDFINFNSNGNYTSQFQGTSSSGIYSIISSSQIIIDGDTATIKTLTDSQFVLYAKQGTATEYDEITINLKR